MRIANNFRSTKLKETCQNSFDSLQITTNPILLFFSTSITWFNKVDLAILFLTVLFYWPYFLILNIFFLCNNKDNLVLYSELSVYKRTSIMNSKTRLPSLG